MIQRCALGLVLAGSLAGCGDAGDAGEPAEVAGADGATDSSVVVVDTALGGADAAGLDTGFIGADAAIDVAPSV
ncbi:MAG: hypothetical protein ABI175_21125, partial [Polyangiales bacterium]